jgi:dihydrofolate reductase
MPPRFSVFIATSLDGYIARADGGLDWLQIVHPLDPSHGYDAFMASVDVLVIGRGTYDTVLGFSDWPYGDKRVIVLTRRPVELRPRVEVFAGDVRELVPRLGGAQRVYIDGGDVIRQCFAAGLVDDVTLSIVPIVLGGGIRLFSGGEGEHRLALDGQQHWPSGLVQMRYRVTAARS